MTDQSPWARSADRGSYILRALIAEFGGEATCLGLSRKLGRFIEASGVHRSDTRTWVQQQIAVLADRGDVTVEATDSAVLIARVTETGACRGTA